MRRQGQTEGQPRQMVGRGVWQLEMDARDVDRVYGAFEAFGWIDQGFIPERHERQTR
jgi:hypothetical protein